MDERNENIPTWTGRAVTTAEVTRSDVELAAKGPSAWNKVDPAGSNPDQSSDRSDDSGLNSSEPGLDRLPRPNGQEVDGNPERAQTISRWLIGLALLALLGAGGYYALSRSRVAPTYTAGAEISVSTTVAVSQAGESGGNESDNEVQPSPATESSAVSESTDFDDVGVGSEQLDPAVLARYSARAETLEQSAWALYENGVIYFEGRVPSEDYAKLLKDRIAAIGPGIVKTSANYVVDPTAPTPTDPPLFLPEVVRFVDDSVEIDPESQRVVDAAPFVVLSFFPEATITIVVAPTVDDDGQPDITLASQRAEEISEGWQVMGLDPSQIFVSVEEDASPDSPDQGSAEFVVRNLLTDLSQ